jgi:hypothetical protein
MFATSRIKLFSAAAVVALALVVGAWTMPTQGGGEETFTIEIVAQSGPILTGEYCLATAADFGAWGDITYSWNGVHWYGSTRNVAANLWNSGWQNLEAFDGIYYDEDDMYIEVSETGDECVS